MGVEIDQPFLSQLSGSLGSVGPVTVAGSLGAVGPVTVAGIPDIFHLYLEKIALPKIQLGIDPVRPKSSPSRIYRTLAKLAAGRSPGRCRM